MTSALCPIQNIDDSERNPVRHDHSSCIALFNAKQSCDISGSQDAWKRFLFFTLSFRTQNDSNKMLRIMRRYMSTRQPTTSTPTTTPTTARVHDALSSVSQKPSAAVSPFARVYTGRGIPNITLPLDQINHQQQQQQQPLSLFLQSPAEFMATLKKHRQQESSIVSDTLEKLVSQNQSTRQWMRNQKTQNGSMAPHEHIEQLPHRMGVISIHAGKNNTIVALSDSKWRIRKQVSGGMCGLKGAQRGTQESGTRATTRVAHFAKEAGYRDVYCTLKGFGVGRESAFRTLVASGLNILRIRDKTSIRHGGTKAKKARRV